MHDFDEVINRYNTYSTQWDYTVDRFGSADVLPLSISDTDFSAPKEVISALQKRLDHPVFGYTRWNHSDYKHSIVSWFKERSNSVIDPDWIVYSPSVIFSVATLMRLKSCEGDGVVLLTPMYDAFYGVVKENKRRLIEVNIDSVMDGYGLDWEGLEKACSNPSNKVLILTNPHNPSGKVFSHEELEKIVQIAADTHTYVISDDIHRDIVYKKDAYHPITDITTKNVALACSATKTFNTPGLGGSYVFIPDEGVREEFLVELKQKNALSSASIMGITAQMASYNECGYYVDEMVAYTKRNMELVKDYLEVRFPEMRFEVPDATYLAWIDVSGLNMSDKEIQRRLVEVGKVGIMSGATYGKRGYLRMNVGCPRSKVEEALRRMTYGIRSQL